MALHQFFFPQVRRRFRVCLRASRPLRELTRPRNSVRRTLRDGYQRFEEKSNENDGLAVGREETRSERYYAFRYPSLSPHHELLRRRSELRSSFVIILVLRFRFFFFLYSSLPLRQFGSVRVASLSRLAEQKIRISFRWLQVASDLFSPLSKQTDTEYSPQLGEVRWTVKMFTTLFTRFSIVDNFCTAEQARILVDKRLQFSFHFQNDHLFDKNYL